MKKTKTISFSTMLVTLLTIFTVLLGALFVAKPANAQSEVRADDPTDQGIYGYNACFGGSSNPYLLRFVNADAVDDEGYLWVKNSDYNENKARSDYDDYQGSNMNGYCMDGGNDEDWVRIWEIDGTGNKIWEIIRNSGHDTLTIYNPSVVNDSSSWLTKSFSKTGYSKSYIVSIVFNGLSTQWNNDIIGNIYDYNEFTLTCSNGTRDFSNYEWGGWDLAEEQEESTPPTPATGVELNIGVAIASLALVSAMFVVVRRKEER